MREKNSAQAPFPRLLKKKKQKPPQENLGNKAATDFFRGLLRYIRAATLDKFAFITFSCMI